MTERITITFEKDGSFRGASSQDFDGQPVPVDAAQLAKIAPGLSLSGQLATATNAIADIKTMQAKIDAFPAEKLALAEKSKSDLAELKASTIPKPETFEEVSKLIATLTESAKSLDRRSQAAAAFGELPEQVQQVFGPLFQALSALPSLADAAKALSAVTVGEDYQGYKDAMIGLLTGKS